MMKCIKLLQEFWFDSFHIFYFSIDGYRWGSMVPQKDQWPRYLFQQSTHVWSRAGCGPPCKSVLTITCSHWSYRKTTTVWWAVCGAQLICLAKVILHHHKWSDLHQHHHTVHQTNVVFFLYLNSDISWSLHHVKSE